MVKPALFDTNILIDFLNGVPQARREVSRYTDRGISVITWMEVMAGAPSGQEQQTASFLSTFRQIPLTTNIAEEAVRVRRATRMKLPDAIILATARIEKRLLLTRNTRDFPANDHSVRVPYKLEPNG